MFWKSHMLSYMSYDGNNKRASGSFSAIFTFSGGKFLRVTLVQLYLYQETSHGCETETKSLKPKNNRKNQRTKTKKNKDFLYLSISYYTKYTDTPPDSEQYNNREINPYFLARIPMKSVRPLPSMGSVSGVR